LTTHFMDEAQHLASRVAVMRAGEIVASGPPNELGGRELRPAEISFLAPAGLSLADLSAAAGMQARMDGGRVLISSREGVRTTQQLTTWALEQGIELEHFQVMQPSLEDVYLELTQ